MKQKHTNSGRKQVEQVLFYQFNDMERLATAREALARLGIASRVVPEEAWREKVGFLLGIKGFKAASVVDEEDDFVFPHEVMVMQNIRHKRLDAVLLALREAGVGDIKFKSVVTPFNTLWTLRRLCETMQREHAELVQSANKEE